MCAWTDVSSSSSRSPARCLFFFFFFSFAGQMSLLLLLVRRPDVSSSSSRSPDRCLFFFFSFAGQMSLLPLLVRRTDVSYSSSRSPDRCLIWYSSCYVAGHSSNHSWTIHVYVRLNSERYCTTLLHTHKIKWNSILNNVVKWDYEKQSVSALTFRQTLWSSSFCNKNSCGVTHVASLSLMCWK